MHTNRQRRRTTPTMMTEQSGPVASVRTPMPHIPSLKEIRVLVAPCLIAVTVLLAAIVGCGGDLMPEEPQSGRDGVPSGTSAASGEASTNPDRDSGADSVPPFTAGGGSDSTPAVSASQVPVTTAAAEAVDSPVAATSFPVPPERDYFQLAAQLIPGAGIIDRVARTQSQTLEPGHRLALKLVDLNSRTLYESEFELRLVTPHAYWFFEDGVQAEQGAIERSASEFEDVIYPAVTGVFGNVWTPGVDGDPHLYIINAHLRGAGGYFNAADEYPKEVRPVSNEIEAIYINARYLPVGTELFSQVLAHELQHAIHWNADLSDETWVNEGLSELAVSIAGYPEHSIFEFRRAGPTSLTQWPANDIGGSENYGAASLFMRYLTEHYGGREDLRPLLEEPADGIPGIDAYLEAVGHEVTFAEVFRDWAVANLLDEDNSPFGYSDLSIRLPVYQNMPIGEELRSSVPQYSNEYVRLEQEDNPARLVFDGETIVPLLPVDVREGCWWSNMGDVIDSTLTARLDLRQAGQPLLEYDVWYSIEEDWDFAYLEVSEDNGRTWTILETPLSSTDDPLDVSFGPGYTGTTEEWRRESVQLDHWAGKEIMLRFQYITDAAIHDHGLCLRDLRVSQEGTQAAFDPEWIPNGFVWINNLVRQSFIVQVVYEGDDGHANRVVQVPLDDRNKGEVMIEPVPGINRIIAVIQPVAPSTRMPTSYTMRLDRVE